MESQQKEARYTEELVHVIQRVSSSTKLLNDFMEDLLSPRELIEISKRWQIVKLLQQEIPHHEIAKKLHTGVATITRGSREMQEENGGFKKTLRILQHK